MEALMTTRDDLAIPTDLAPKGRKAAEAILSLLREKAADDTGGCKAFYSPEEWAERGESYGTESLLVVVHDGGCHAPFFNLDYCMYGYWEAMSAHLRKHGVYAEQCTSWYTAIYPL
jgi:hypothetical protein